MQLARPCAIFKCIEWWICDFVFHFYLRRSILIREIICLYWIL